MNEIHTETNEENAKRTRNAYIDETLEGHSLKIKDLSFKYDIYSPKDILSDINLSIPNGKVTAIVGASGSGKTTLLRAASYLTRADGGSVILDGEEFDLSRISGKDLLRYRKKIRFRIF